MGSSRVPVSTGAYVDSYSIPVPSGANIGLYFIPVALRARMSSSRVPGNEETGGEIQIGETLQILYYICGTITYIIDMGHHF